MRILLIGEYSNVHATLARGLRALGHEVSVASNGDYWKNYPRDIDLARTEGKLGGISLMAKVYLNLSKYAGYDIVQLINPLFMELKAERLFKIYEFLRTHNKRVVLGAFGMDYYWVYECITSKPLRYSDFNIGDKLRSNADAAKERNDWLGTAKELLNKYIANDCDAIVAGLYEYWVCYHPNFPAKTTFIPFPIELPDTKGNNTDSDLDKPLKIFIGINKSRSEYKGTDIMLKAAESVAAEYPNDVELLKAESVPFDEYRRMMDGSDVILDQLYSYTPAMNSLLAMSKGIINVGGGEPENYEIINEHELQPIINVEPNYDSVRNAIERLVRNRQDIPRLKAESIEYVRRHHDYIKVAREYIALYERLI